VNQFPFPKPCSGQLAHDVGQRQRENRAQERVCDLSERFVPRPAVLVLGATVPERDRVVHIADEDRVVRQVEQVRPFAYGLFVVPIVPRPFLERDSPLQPA
jgi:hypothetical protein